MRNADREAAYAECAALWWQQFYDLPEGSWAHPGEQYRSVLVGSLAQSPAFRAALDRYAQRVLEQLAVRLAARAVEEEGTSAVWDGNEAEAFRQGAQMVREAMNTNG